MISKKDLVSRIFDLECVIDLLEDRIAKCERAVEKKTRRKNEIKK